MTKPIRFGILGYGKMGKIRHDALNQFPDCELVAIYEPSTPSETPEGVAWHNSPEELLARDDLDAIIVSTPNQHIKNFVVEALESGKHVFSEKPPGRNLQETLQMKEAASRTKRKLMFGFNHRHHDSVIAAKEIIDSEKYGEILWMRGRYGKSVPPDFHENWRANKELAGGGIFLDQGIHMLDLFMHMVGPFEQVKSFVSNLYWSGDIEDNVFALFKNKKGQVASLHSTMTQWRHLFSLEIFLSQGYIVINGLKTSSNTYGEETLSYAKNRTVAPTATWSDEETISYTIDNSWKRELGIFIESIVEDKAITTCGVDDAVDLMEMVEKVYQES